MRNCDTILFDLDGTLLDPRKRLYKLFKELTNCSLSYEEYWREKGKGKKQSDMLKLVGSAYSLEEFRKKWLENVERSDLLLVDEIFPETQEVLTYMKKRGMKLYLVTNRQSYEGTCSEIKALNIDCFFDGIVVTEQQCRKAEAVMRAGICCNGAIFVGDSLEDMDAARDLGVPGVFVMREKKDAEIENDIYIRNLRELRGLVNAE